MSISFTAPISLPFSRCRNYFRKSLVPVWIPTMSGFLRDSWLIVVDQVLRWCPRTSSNFNWITTRHIPSIDVFYYWIPNNNVFLVFYFRMMSLRCRFLKRSHLHFFQSAVFWNVLLIFFIISKGLVSSGMTNTFITCLSRDRVTLSKDVLSLK